MKNWKLVCSALVRRTYRINTNSRTLNRERVVLILAFGAWPIVGVVALLFEIVFRDLFGLWPNSEILRDYFAPITCSVYLGCLLISMVVLRISSKCRQGKWKNKGEEEHGEGER